MTLLTELIPVIAFFVAYQLHDLYTATLATMTCSTLQLFISLIRKKPISVIRWVNVSVLLLLGGITFISNNHQFIQVKPTIGYGILAATLAVTSYRTNSTLLETHFGNTVYLSKQSWKQLNNAWIIFFCSMGLLNLIIAFTTTTKVWVYFKLFGTLGLTAAFIAGQIVYFKAGIRS